jgi:hypothetical protein
MYHADHPPLGIPLDHLADEEPGLYLQSRPTATARTHSITEHMQKGRDIAGQPVHADQKGEAFGTRMYPPDQFGDQPSVAMLTDDPTQPQARGHR